MRDDRIRTAAQARTYIRRHLPLTVRAWEKEKEMPKRGRRLETMALLWWYAWTTANERFREMTMEELAKLVVCGMPSCTLREVDDFIRALSREVDVRVMLDAFFTGK